MSILCLGFSVGCNVFMLLLCQYWYNEAYKMRQQLEDLSNELEAIKLADARRAGANDR